MNILMTFGERLNELMKYNAQNAEGMGKLSGITSQQIRRYATGKDIRISTLLRLADFFHCSLDYLSGRSEVFLDYIPHDCPPFMKWLPVVIKQSNKSTYKIFKETRIKSSYFALWRKGGEPLLSTLILLADYLDCSIDYLVGRER